MRPTLKSALLFIASLPFTAAAEEQPSGAANNPLANMTAFNRQNYYIGDVSGAGKNANQFRVRYAQPFSPGENKWLLRASLPIVRPSFSMAIWQPGGGTYLRSAPIWNANVHNDSYGVPPGPGIGQVMKRENTVYNVFVEPQASVADHGPGQPRWQIFAGLNLQFLN